MPSIYAMKKKPQADSGAEEPFWDYKTGVPGLVRNTSSGKYYTRVQVGGTRRMIALKTDVWSTAKLRHAKELSDAELQRQSAKRVEGGAATMGDLLNRYQEEYKANTARAERSKRLLEDTINRLVRNWDTCFNADLRSTKPGRITLEQVRRFSNYLHSEALHRAFRHTHDKKGYKAVTVNKTLELLHRIVRVGVEVGAIPYLPFDLNPILGGPVRKPEHAKKVRLPSSEQMQRIFAEMRKAGDLMKSQDESLKAHIRGVCEESAEFAEFMAYSGARVGEARAFRWEDDHGQMIILRGTKTKTSRDREVPKIQAMQALLIRMRARRMEAGDKVSEGQVFAIKQCRQSLHAACKRVGVPRISHHMLRHYFATIVIESGADIPTLSRWLGHSDGGVLAMKTYGHLRIEHSLLLASKVTG